MVGAVHKAKSVPGLREKSWIFGAKAKLRLPKNAAGVL
jgi:hypothetical protein